MWTSETFLVIIFNCCCYSTHPSPESATPPNQLVCLFVLFTPVGARVFARWNNGLYYRGFVTKATSTNVFITYDDGDTITLLKSDRTAVILDKLPCYSHVKPGQRVIGYWPGRTRYYPGVVESKGSTGSNNYYHVKFDDGDQRMEDFNQIRLIP